jgi:hypothetical protein
MARRPIARLLLAPFQIFAQRLGQPPGALGILVAHRRSIALGANPLQAALTQGGAFSIAPPLSRHRPDMLP